jgi:hypothetical protein
MRRRKRTLAVSRAASQKAWRSRKRQAEARDAYDPHDDVTKAFEEAYRVIRERVAAGGPPWVPKEKAAE